MKNHHRFLRVAFLTVVVAVLVGSHVSGQVSRQDSSKVQQSVRFADQIAAYLKQDSTNPPPKNAIVFIGSSIFRQWAHLKVQMAPLPVFNRAFGGSRTIEVLRQVETLILPYEPRIVVYYCGSNDVNAGISASEILHNFKSFCDKVSGELPKTKIFFVSINRAPQKMNRWNVVDSANTLVKKYCESTPHRGYIDVNPVLFDNDGKPKMELYRDDKLHFKDPAYEEFTKVIKPVLETAWKQY